MDCSPPGSSVHGDSPAKNTGVGCHAFLQGIFSNQGLKPGLQHCRRILNQLRHQGSPRILEWVAYPFFRGSSQSRNRTRVSCRRILHQLSYQGRPWLLVWRESIYFALAFLMTKIHHTFIPSNTPNFYKINKIKILTLFNTETSVSTINFDLTGKCWLFLAEHNIQT